MDYETLRHFADSWGLLFFVLTFIGIVLWVLRPGAGRQYDDAASIPFRHERAADDLAVERTGAGGKDRMAGGFGG